MSVAVIDLVFFKYLFHLHICHIYITTKGISTSILVHKYPHMGSSKPVGKHFQQRSRQCKVSGLSIWNQINICSQMIRRLNFWFVLDSIHSIECLCSSECFFNEYFEWYKIWTVWHKLINQILCINRTSDLDLFDWKQQEVYQGLLWYNLSACH
jgi:hypothetical protein